MRICFILLALMFAGDAMAASVSEQGGSIFYTGDEGVPRKLTSGHVDSGPLLSPDGNTVVFLRTKPKKNPLDSDEDELSEIWLSDVSGNTRRLLDVKQDDDPLKNLSYINHPAFSNDGQQLYFLTKAWATSNAVHVLDIKTGRENFVIDGDTLDVLTKGRYAGHLVVQRHKYFKRSGSYDYFWLVTPGGREIKRVGKTEEQAEHFIKSQK